MDALKIQLLLKIVLTQQKLSQDIMVEFADLFAKYFAVHLEVGERDFLTVDESLTRELLDKFRGPVPFCSQCDIRSRHKEIISNKPSERKICEWSEYYKS